MGKKKKDIKSEANEATAGSVEEEELKEEPKQPTSEEIIEELKDKVTRQMAEFDNFRKRNEKEKAARFEIGQRSVIEKLLPVIDNFERGLSTLTDEQKEDAFVQGMDKTYQQMIALLEELGVSAIPSVGEKFNPDFHEAIMHIEDESLGEGEIVEELQKGYKLGDTVIRYAMVKVAN